MVSKHLKYNASCCYDRFHYKISLLFLVLAVLSLLVIVIPTSLGFATSDNPYQSGYNHGCEDARISDSSDRYINQPEKGPGFHTNAFVDGYYNGFNACSDVSDNNVEDEGNTSNGEKFRVLVRFVEGQDGGNIDFVRVYVKEYPQYFSQPDLDDAFYNDDPYTGIYKDELVMPSGLINNGETFNICIDDKDENITLACYRLENTEKRGPEELTIDFNNFP